MESLKRKETFFGGPPKAPKQNNLFFFFFSLVVFGGKVKNLNILFVWHNKPVAVGVVFVCTCADTGFLRSDQIGNQMDNTEICPHSTQDVIRYFFYSFNASIKILQMVSTISFKTH